MEMVKNLIKTLFIIIAEVFENSVFVALLQKFRWFMVERTLKKNKVQWIFKLFSEEIVSTRKFPRVKVKNEVMIKKNAGSQAEIGPYQVMLKDGLMLDFSRGGAKISTKDINLKVKDIVNLMYKNKNGKWVSVESQIRWTRVLLGGEILMGVQFLRS